MTQPDCEEQRDKPISFFGIDGLFKIATPAFGRLAMTIVLYVL